MDDISKQNVDVGEDKQVRKRKTKAQLNRERCVEEFRQLLETKGGRHWVWRLLTYCKAFNSISGVDAHNMAVASGTRDAGLWVLDEVFQSNPSAFTLMMKEAEERDI